MATLSAGSVQAIFQGQGGLKPTLQILELRRVQSPQSTAGPSPERYRVICSDGQHYLLGMLATQLNARVASKELDAFTIIRVDDYLCQPVQGRRYFVDIRFEIG
jgi:replication factor A1